MAYNGSVDLISGIRPKNNGTFPLVDAKDVYVTDDKRLDAALDEKMPAADALPKPEAGGAEGQFLKNGADGATAWGDVTAEEVKVTDEKNLDAVLAEKADADDVIPKPEAAGTEGDVLRINSSGSPEWTDPAMPTDSQVREVVTDWLEENPEAIPTELGDQIDDIKSAFGDITGNRIVDFSDPALKQYINTNVSEGTAVSWDTPSVSSTTNIKWAAVECAPGDQFTISGKGGNSDRLWAWLNASKQLIDKSASGATANGLVITAPANAAYLIINSETDVPSYYGVLLQKTVEDGLASKLDVIYSPYDFAIPGNGSTVAQRDFQIVPGHRYKATIINAGMYSGASADIRFQISTKNGEGTYSAKIYTADPSGVYYFDADYSDARVYIRADAGETFICNVDDATTETPTNIASFATGFEIERGSNSITVSWSRLYVQFQGSAFDTSESAEYTLDSTHQVLVLRQNSAGVYTSIQLYAQYSSLRTSDIVLLAYNGGNVCGGILTPYIIEDAAQTASSAAQTAASAASDAESAAQSVAQLINTDVKAFFTIGFAVAETITGVTVSWTRLYIKRRDDELNTTTPASYAMSNNYPLLVWRNNGVMRLGSFGAVNANDIVLLIYRDGVIGGLLYPVYAEAFKGYTYSDDAHLNTSRNFNQILNIPWTPLFDVNSGEGLLPADVPMTGVPYSSVKEYLKYVGIDVSLHTFATTVRDPHSLMYTEYPMGVGSQSAYGRTYHGVNSKCYFGSVCSGAVTTAIGSDIQYNSWEYQSFPEVFEVLANQDTKNLEVGDILSYNGHCCVLTGIIRDKNGLLKKYVLSEHTAPIKSVNYSPNSLQNRTIAEGGVWCRYKMLENNTKYKASPFVLAADEYLYDQLDIVYRDAQDASAKRTFYYAKASNSDAQWTPGNWQEIGEFTPNTQYRAMPVQADSYCSVGEKLYQCIKSHTSGSTIDLANWREIKGIVEWAAYPYEFNDDIITFAGDRAAFHSGDLIYINYTKGNYTSMQIYKDGTLIQTLMLPGTGYQIDVSSYCAGAGMYKARLTNGTDYSRFTYFEVIDTTVSATYTDGVATVQFSSANGTPIEVQIVEQSGATICHNRLSASELRDGVAVINPGAKMYVEKHMYPNRYEGYSATGYARVMFAGEYGNVVNAMIELGTVTPVIGDLVRPDGPADLGIVTGAATAILTETMAGNRYAISFEPSSSAATVSIVSAMGNLKWINALPATLEAGKPYLVNIENGIGDVVSIG